MNLNPMTWLSLALILICIFIVLIGIAAKLNRPKINKEKYRNLWHRIEQNLKKDSTDSFHLSVIQADKLLDHAMKERGIRGSTMGERMKRMQNEWTNPNAVWGAHKLRNRIAHEPEVVVNYQDAKRALSAFRQALKDVGAL